MIEVPCMKVKGNATSGYQECWYSGKTRMNIGIPASENDIDEAVRHVEFYGTPISMDFHWSPAPVPYDSKLFLYKGANIIHSSLRPRGIVNDVPMSTIYIIASDKNTLCKVAKELNLEARV